MSVDLPKASLRPENILRKQFPNGLTVLIHEDHRSGTAAICGSLAAGSCLDAPDKRGMSAFMSAALQAGTLYRTSSQISGYLEGIGASLAFGSSPHMINVSGKCLAEDLPDILKLLKEKLESPAFRQNELEVIQWEALDEIQPDPLALDSCSYDMFKMLLWGTEHPYGRITFDDAENMAILSRDDLVAFFERYVGPKKSILAISGDFMGEKLMDCCAELFGSWSKSQEDVDEDVLFQHPGPITETNRLNIDFKSWKESSLVIGTFGPAVGDPDYLPVRLGSCVLGESGPQGRIGRRVRYQHGLAYEVYSCPDLRKKGGSWSVMAGVAPGNLAKAGDMILEELTRITKVPVGQREFNDVKSAYIDSLPLSFRSNSDTAALLHGLEFYERGLDYYSRFRERVNAITPEQVLEAARKWIDPQKMVIVTAGPGDGNKRTGFW